MIRFMLRLVGALLVEEICERIAKLRPVPFPLAPLGKPDGWLRYYGPASVVGEVKRPTLISEPLLSGDVPGYRVTREGATMHFTSTDPDPYWKDEADPYKLTLCTLDENGNPNPLWRWCYLPAYRVWELEGKRGMNGSDETTATA